MNLIQVPTYADLSRVAADLICAAVAHNPRSAVVVATGDTPMGAYAELAQRHALGQFDSAHLRVFQLDAYWGLLSDDARALYGWMWRSFLQPLHISDAQVTRLKGDAADPAAVCAAYDVAVAQVGGFEVSILGLGPNGHLGFNEPPSPADAPTRMVNLTEASIASNARYWGGREHVPTQALTCGMAPLLAAKQTLLLVSGARKRHILQQTLYGPITPDVPASLLRLANHVTVIADQAALGG